MPEVKSLRRKAVVTTFIRIFTRPLVGFNESYPAIKPAEKIVLNRTD